MNVVFRLLEKITKVIGYDSDIEIIETHHRYKTDMPSGTSLEIKSEITKSLKKYTRNFNDKNINKVITNKKKINLSSIRIGDVIGEHTVIFADMGERIEISHKASNRTIFANGALKSALWLWLKKKRNGLFNMKDVLELDKI